jgi:tRNA A-37 threonylcarbamoyl transferase component Bud32
VARLTAALAGRYRIERALGQGGMATVYLAEDLKHDRKVAIKVLKPELAAVLGAERFVQEIKTTAALSHPHILPLFDSGEAGGFLYYVMPYIQGETIREKLTRETQFGVEEAVRIATEVADALDYAHRHGVIHRDIKPENILLHDGRPMVMDFGIALAVSAAAGGRMTETGLSLGTPHYMSPEQATAEKEITGRSDVYSLASVLYEMLAGQPPHLGGSAQQVIMKIIAEPAPVVTQFRKTVPPNVAAALATALEKLPADRFGSAKAFAEALADRDFTTHTTAASGFAVGRPGIRGWLGDVRTVALLAVASFSLAGLLWVRTGRQGVPGPRTYDVTLPDSAALDITLQQSFDIARSGDFTIYQAREPQGTALWYRSLRDDTARRIEGTAGGQRPAISPDGSRVAFVRFREQPKWSLEVIPVGGGATATLGNGVGEANLQWLDDGRIQVLEGDGNHIRWFDPEGGKTDSRRIAFCQLPVYLVDRDEFLCSGARLFAWRVAVADSLRERGVLVTRTSDSSRVFGSDFRVVDGKYLVYLSIGGDLLAAPVDLGTGTVGRSVRLLTGVGRSDFLGAGIYSLSRNGTLVYAEGANRAVGNLVTTDGRTEDTLDVGREAFHLFAMSPDRGRLAAVVDGLHGQELRVYDLRTGAPAVIARGSRITQPVWSPRGESLLFTRSDSVFHSQPDRSEPTRLIAVAPASFEAFSWSAEDRVVGSLWDTYHAVSLDPTRSPVVWDTLATSASFPVESPDGRWIAYSDPDLATVWVSPLVATGQRYQVATGSVAEPQWRSNREIVINAVDDSTTILRIGMDASRPSPVFTRLGTIGMPGYVETAGLSYGLTPDGRILYVRTAKDEPKRFLRVVPDWVAQMKQAVDEANR